MTWGQAVTRPHKIQLDQLGQKEIMDVLKYEITYKVGNDIPINPEWIKDQIRAAVGKLQAEIDKKNLHGQHRLEFYYPDGHGRVGPQAPSSKP